MQKGKKNEVQEKGKCCIMFKDEAWRWQPWQVAVEMREDSWGAKFPEKLSHLGFACIEHSRGYKVIKRGCGTSDRDSALLLPLTSFRFYNPIKLATFPELHHERSNRQSLLFINA